MFENIKLLKFKPMKEPADALSALRNTVDFVVMLFWFVCLSIIIVTVCIEKSLISDKMLALYKSL